MYLSYLREYIFEELNAIRLRIRASFILKNVSRVYSGLFSTPFAEIAVDHSF